MEKLTRRLAEVPECVHLKALQEESFDCRKYAMENCDNLCDSGCPIGDAFKKLADYEDAEEDGRIFRADFKPGDTAYIVKRSQNIFNGYICWIIEEINILDVSAGGFITDDVERYIWYDPSICLIFKTEEEAKAVAMEKEEEEQREMEDDEDEDEYE